MSVKEKINNVLGVEGDFIPYVRPMVRFTSANITLGGAGYTITQFHSPFLTKVEGLDTEQTARIGLINGLWDAFNDPVMGIISDRTRSKWGKHRPYMLFSAVPFALSVVMRWTSFGISGIFGGGSTAVWLWYLFSAILYSTSYTVAAIPHEAMMPTVAPQYFLRTQYKTVEYMMNSVGQVSSYVFAALVLSGFNVVTALNGLPEPTPADRGKYLWIGIVLAIWFLWPQIYCFCTTKEPSSLGMHNDPVNVRYILHEYKLVFSNRSFRLYFFIQLFFGLARSFYGQTLSYFMMDVANQYKYYITMNVVAGTAEFMGTPLNYLLGRYRDKTLCGKVTGPLMVAGLALNGLITPSMPENRTKAIIFVSAILYNFGFSGPGFVGDTIQSDVTDVDEMITGRRREGTIATFYSLFKKTINSLVGYAVGLSLKLFGYDPKEHIINTETNIKKAISDKSLFGLRLNFSFIPTVLAIICLIFIGRYKMTAKEHEEIRRALKQRREKGKAVVLMKDKRRFEQIAGQKWSDMWIGSRDEEIRDDRE